MLARIRQCRTAVHAALAALVVVSLSHCAWEESREMAQRSKTFSLHRMGLPTPVQMPVHDCDHEYGCICRGATLVHATTIIDWQPQLADLLPTDVFWVPAVFLEPECTDSRIDEEQNLPPPLSGRQLRARYASLVI